MKQVAAAVGFNDGRALVTRRAANQELAGFWEFSGGKLEPVEDVQTRIARLLQSAPHHDRTRFRSFQVKT